MLKFGIGVASPSKFLSSPAIILSTVDLPEPFRPSTPILAPGKNARLMFLRIWRCGGTVLFSRFIEKTYCAMANPAEVKADYLRLGGLLGFGAGGLHNLRPLVGLFAQKCRKLL